jgi:hypothetical protein
MAPDDLRQMIERRLMAVLAHPEGVYVADYADALITAQQAAGSEALTNQEQLLASAMACDTCIQSGGFASCFEYVAPHLLRAQTAMTMIGLPQHADLFRQALETADTRTIADAPSRATFLALRDEGFADMIEQFEPIEDAYFSLGLSTVTDAVLAYIQKNHGSLRHLS